LLLLPCWLPAAATPAYPAAAAAADLAASQSPLQAINFWLGSVVMHIWEFINPAAAGELGPTVGAGLLVGDGLWAIPSSLLAIMGKAPPLCLGFWDGKGCKLPYCGAVWLGGSKDRLV
jgi:hypothetical protein